MWQAKSGRHNILWLLCVQLGGASEAAYCAVAEADARDASAESVDKRTGEAASRADRVDPQA
jgi:hypothetical protein